MEMKKLLARLRDEERGDVPGWVLITAMTAGLVIAIWALAGSALTQVFTNAVNSVMTGP
ncbi:hypothetical protein [Gryllotalpicola protaetiae]|uniref:hypothetical protein n=1 Tax=Gryllotalpicola protaetiae TaxID=2419771 RepID=UPI0013C3EA77|nr:hypothetical protein [Gryllotalpicola protaetiae]